jgi:hypothetical protein
MVDNEWSGDGDGDGDDGYAVVDVLCAAMYCLVNGPGGGFDPDGFIPTCRVSILLTLS